MIDDCEKSLIVHLRHEFDTTTLPTIKEYAGEFRDPDDAEAFKLTELVPACFTVFTDGRPTAEDAYNQFDLYIVTESRTLDKAANKTAGMQLASDILTYLRKRHIFQRQGGKRGTYEIYREQTTANTLAITSRFVVIRIQLYIYDHTQEAV